MSLVVNHNMMAANVANNLNGHYGKLATSTQRLSTGLRISSAADDAAGLAIRELQRADIAALHQGARNANDAISLIQVADGALGIIDEKLIRMKELAEQAATGTYDSTQRMMIESEYQQMASEITRIANATDFNGIHLLDGSLSGAHDGSGVNATGKLKIHFGAGNDSAEDYYYVEIGSCTAASLGLGNNAYKTPEEKEEFTYNTYQNILEKSSYEAYKTTFADKYTEFYTSIYNKLRNGVPPTRGLSETVASTQAKTIASNVAKSYAEDDKDMVNAAFDKIYVDTKPSAYLTAYNNIMSGMSISDAMTDTEKTANDEAINAVIESAREIAQNGTITGSAIQGNLPPLTRAGAEAFIKQLGNEGYRSTYDSIYDSIMNSSTIQAAMTELGYSYTGGDYLYDEEFLEIHNQIDKIASSMAEKFGTQFENAMWFVYDGTYHSQYDIQRNSIRTAHPEWPEKVVDMEAENRTAALAWQKMKDTIDDAESSGTAFGQDYINETLDKASSSGTKLGQPEFTPDKLSMTVHRKGDGIQFTFTAIQDISTVDIDSIYKEVVGNLNSYLDNYGLSSHLDGVVYTAKEIASEYDEFHAEPQLELRDGGTISTQEAAQRAIVAINEAIVSKDKIRAHLGATQNRLENTITNLNTQAENLQAAESRISDVDVATEMTEFVRQQILTQSAVAMLSQANSMPQMAMQIIGG